MATNRENIMTAGQGTKLETDWQKKRGEAGREDIGKEEPEKRSRQWKMWNTWYIENDRRKIFEIWKL